MSGTTSVQDHVDTERARLVAALRDLTPEQWRAASLCEGWSVRELVAHLLMPYELSIPRFAALMLRCRLDFDRAADRWARADTRSPREVLTALVTTERKVFNVPGSPPEAPLSHLVIHAQDVYRPLGLPSTTDPDAARIVLVHLMTLRRSVLPADVLERLTLVATDSDWRQGHGLEVAGPGTALLTTLTGRTAALGELEGPGVTLLRERLLL